MHAEHEKEPWLLATSLSSSLGSFAKKIVKIYHTRMQIEESFRDVKAGLNFNESNTRKLAQLCVLLLIANLAQYLLYLLGLAVSLQGKQRRYQANSLEHRVLAYQFIGLRAVQDKQLSVQLSDWRTALEKLQMLMAEHLHV